MDGSSIAHLCGSRRTPLPPLRRGTSLAPNHIKTWTGALMAHLCGSRRTPLPPLTGNTSVAPNHIKTWTGAELHTSADHGRHLCHLSGVAPLRGGTHLWPEPLKNVGGSSYCTPLRVTEGTSRTSQVWRLCGSKPYKTLTAARIAHLCGSRRRRLQ